MQEALLSYLKDHPLAVFILCILGGVGSWIIGLSSWQMATTPQAIGSLILSLASVTGAGGAASFISKINSGASKNGQ